MAKRVRELLFVFLVESVLRMARLLWRVKLVNEPNSAAGPCLYAHWHGDELLLVPTFAHRGYAVMSSRSRDGEAMAFLLTRLGYAVVRGSSSRGGAGGLKGLIDAVRVERRSAAIAVDGPRGPVFQAKPGIFFLSQSTGLPIVPAGAFASRRWSIRGAWNQGYFPKPFARCAVVFGEPLRVPLDCDDVTRDALRLELEKRLAEVKEKARQEIFPLVSGSLSAQLN